MFEVGFSELLLIFAIALVVLGPQRLPKLAQQVGRWVGRARAMARQFREQLEEEAHNLEKQMDIDPDIDTSLEPKSKPAAPPTTTSPAASADPAPPAPVTPPETEEDFYPPDHHMHPSNRARDPDPRVGEVSPPMSAEPADTDPRADADAGAQGEFDLTSPAPPGDGPKP